MQKALDFLAPQHTVVISFTLHRGDAACTLCTAAAAAAARENQELFASNWWPKIGFYRTNTWNITKPVRTNSLNNLLFHSPVAATCESTGVPPEIGRNFGFPIFSLSKVYLNKICIKKSLNRIFRSFDWSPRQSSRCKIEAARADLSNWPLFAIFDQKIIMVWNFKGHIGNQHKILGRKGVLFIGNPDLTWGQFSLYRNVDESAISYCECS